MIRIGILSDTHGHVPQQLYDFFKNCDEIWHAGDIGNAGTVKTFMNFKPLRAVRGNIDGQDIRMEFPEAAVFTVEKIKVAMIHIGGYPGRYSPMAKELIRKEKPNLFVTGHSHILKVMYDKKNGMLLINPGAAGNSGFHKSITLVRLVIDGENMKDLEVLDIPRKGKPGTEGEMASPNEM
jgi:uncharacterized protein